MARSSRTSTAVEQMKRYMTDQGMQERGNLRDNERSNKQDVFLYFEATSVLLSHTTLILDSHKVANFSAGMENCHMNAIL